MATLSDISGLIVPNLIVDRTYTAVISFWASAGAPTMMLTVDSVALGAPNSIKEAQTEVRATFVATADTCVIALGAMGPGSGAVWAAGFLVTEGVYTGSYFDGSTPDTSTYVYGWEGAADNSVSTRTVVSGNLPVRDILDPYGEAKANNSKAVLKVHYRSGWAG